jgi:hypothetical protein
MKTPDNPFEERYSTLSNADLLRILKSAAVYQPLAVETAQAELNKRKLTQAQLAEANDELAEAEDIQAHKAEKIKATGDKVKSVINELLEYFKPIHSAESSQDRIITIVSILLLGLFLYQVRWDFGVLMMAIGDIRNSYLEILYYALSLIYLPVTAFLFWRRKKAGWMLLSCLLTYTLFTTLSAIIISMKERSLPEGFEVVVPTPSRILTLFFQGAFLALLCRNNLRLLFKINRRTMLLIVGLTCVLTTAMWWGLIVK